jgi:hypothetical protein
LAERHNDGKPKLSFLFDFPNAIEMFAEVTEYGASKYSINNWKKGLPVRRVVDSLMRHLSAFMDGEMVDEESRCSHLGHIIWNAMALGEMGIRKDMDDR